jgi:hypothetical protein
MKFLKLILISILLFFVIAGCASLPNDGSSVDISDPSNIFLQNLVNDKENKKEITSEITTNNEVIVVTNNVNNTSNSNGETIVWRAGEGKLYHLRNCFYIKRNEDNNLPISSHTLKEAVDVLHLSRCKNEKNSCYPPVLVR